MAPDTLPPDAAPLYWRDGDETDPSIVGRSTDALFVVSDNGTVWLVPEGPSPRVFVNRTTERFYESMAVFQPAWRSLGPHEDATETVERIANDLRRIDGAAFSDRSFWPLVLEQVQDGLL
jgi:hypothetical protein